MSKYLKKKESGTESHTLKKKKKKRQPLISTQSPYGRFHQDIVNKQTYLAL